MDICALFIVKINPPRPTLNYLRNSFNVVIFLAPRRQFFCFISLNLRTIHKNTFFHVLLLIDPRESSKNSTHLLWIETKIARNSCFSMCDESWSKSLLILSAWIHKQFSAALTISGFRQKNKGGFSSSPPCVELINSKVLKGNLINVHKLLSKICL